MTTREVHVKKVFWISLIATAFFAVSCAGAPPPKPQQSVAPVSGDQMGAVKEKRDYVVKNGLDAYAPDPFAQAEAQYSAAEKIYGSDPAGAQAGLAAALPLYEKTIQDGFAKKIEEKKAAADAARVRADAEKAKVAAASEYGAADAAYAEAKKAQAEGKLPEAAGAYEQAAAGFDGAAKLAVDRRAQAQDAMREADEAIKATDERINAIGEEMKNPEGGAQ
jgi:hypothetical protein